MKCERCGREVGENLLLCPGCGNILHKEEKKEEDKPSSPNPFCSTGPKEEKKNIEPYIPKPTIVDKKYKDLFTSVVFYLSIFIYVFIITALTVALNNEEILTAILKTIGFKPTLYLARFLGVLKGNFFFAIIFVPFFYKCDIPYWVAYIPYINILVYFLNALQGEGKAIRNCIIAYIVFFLIENVIPRSVLLGTRIAGIFFGIIGVCAALVFLAEALHIGIKVGANYSDRFGYKRAGKILFILLPIIMIIVTIFSKDKKYSY